MKREDATRKKALPGNREAKNAREREPVLTGTGNAFAPRLDDGVSSEDLSAPPLHHWRDQADGFFSE